MSGHHVVEHPVPFVVVDEKGGGESRDGGVGG